MTETPASHPPHRFWCCVATTLTALAAAIEAQAQRPSTNQPSVSEIATAYTNYQRMTDKPVLVNPELAMLCRGISKDDVRRAAKESGPHANTSIIVYMNSSAANAFQAKTNTYPVGSVVVKQKEDFGYRDNEWKRHRSSDTGVGGMIKRPAGYDPKHGDWEYFYFENPKKIESGRISSCVKCHDAAKATDRVFGHWRLDEASQGTDRR